MAIPKKPASLKDFFNTVANPISNAAPTPQTGFRLRTMTLPNDGGTFQTQAPTASVGGRKINIDTAQAPAAPAPTTGSRIFRTPTTPAAPVPTTEPMQIPPQWIKPGGGLYTPDEVAANIAKSLPTTAAGDVPRFAGDQFSNRELTSEELMQQAMLLNNARNDIAVGETDPYKIASESDIAYSPAELKAIENAYAGIYDPAITSALAKLESRQKLEKEDREFQNELKKMGVEFEYQKKLKQTPSGGTLKSGNGITGSGARGITYKSDLDAIVGNTLATINSKFGQEQFTTQISRARNDADKISTVASVVLKNAPADIRRDFGNQAMAVGSIDQAIKALDEGTKTGFLQNGAQYVFNTFGQDYDPNLATIGAYITSAIQPYRNSITGAAWGSQEEQEYQKLFGSTKYSPEELKLRLNNLKKIMADKSAQALNVYVNPLGTYDNVFSSQSPSAPATAPSSDWFSTYNYDEDIAAAREAIANGKDPEAVRARLLEKYETVDL